MTILANLGNNLDCLLLFLKRSANEIFLFFIQKSDITYSKYINSCRPFIWSIRHKSFLYNHINHQRSSGGGFESWSMKKVDAIRHWVFIFSFISSKSFSSVPIKFNMSSMIKSLLYFSRFSAVTKRVTS